ncbi:HNH endonuclease family protein [Streptomyces sp. NPDC047070]|uniref:HNH endonuclease family protein n=1 Tax=Streptomyces sp. NPDC047070 TaxID=3154923 RepID=UPI00345407DA
MNKLLRYGLPAFALAALPLLATAPPAAAATAPGHERPFTSPAPAQPPTSGGGSRAPLPLFEAVDRIPVAVEQREGYKRDLYRHWNKGLDARDGCDTRREVILSEAVEKPEVSAGCKLTGGSWLSPYDGVTVTAAGGLDVDHMVPLAEVHDSGGYAWDAARREAYANDQASPMTLIAVTAKSNRSKADKDPAQWMPQAGGYRCQYTAEWVATKLRWDLAADEAEREALLGLAQDCPGTTVDYEPAGPSGGELR